MTANRNTVLIVEDDLFISMDAADCVARTGANVVTTETVEDAIGIVERGNICAAILDFRVLDGVITPLLKKLEASGIPYRVVSGSSPAELAAEGIPPACCTPKPADYLRVLGLLNNARRSAMSPMTA